ncbi:hypothetical protein [Roseomonas sp. 18066]|uniref:hypothetical protein n=1 Tax=Roseomonas sp. 18066 TaxID=2681412 RepID=UPI0013582AC7|nr:hypothetical protein [Roseomonas sp. 18066]
MPLTLRTDAMPSLKTALVEQRHWDGIVHRVTKEYAVAKVAVNTDRDSAAAAAVFTTKSDRLMQAMAERHRCEMLVAHLRKTLRPF